MKTNISPRSINTSANNNPHERKAQLHRQADEMLRDIAFVLMMTERIRDQMEAEDESREQLAFA